MPPTRRRTSTPRVAVAVRLGVGSEARLLARSLKAAYHPLAGRRGVCLYDWRTDKRHRQFGG